MSDDLKERAILGDRIVYYDRGSGPALVLLHGMFGDHLDWEPVLAPLSATYRVIAPDLPGFGASDKPDRDYTPEFFVESLHELLMALDIPGFTLVGNSFGGSISILYTIAHPERVGSLVLVSSGGMRSYSDGEVAHVQQRFSEDNVRAITPSVQRMMLVPIFARESDHRERYLEKQAAKLSQPDFSSYARSLSRAACMAFPLFLRKRLAEIDCPTLLLWGDADVVFPPALARKAVEGLPNGRLTLLPDCGHVPQLDDPEAFVLAIRDFVPIQTRAGSQV